MSRALLIQLARLGDLVQSLPAIAALHALDSERPLDLLCAAPLAPLGALFPGISKVYPWDGLVWQSVSDCAGKSWEQQFRHMRQVWTEQAFPAYSVAYNLNNHPRSILASHLLAEQVIGPGAWGPVNPRLSPWEEYLRAVGRKRGSNRIHLSDAFCGFCRVKPLKNRPGIVLRDTQMPSGLESLGESSGRPVIGLILGAGDVERRIPVDIWRRLVQECAAALPHACLVLIGGVGEKEIALALENALPLACLNRVINICGRTSLRELVGVLGRCQWVVGSDTGPLHVSTLCGARTVGWYFARARVHETGPYGAGHYVWQHSLDVEVASGVEIEALKPSEMPRVWPVEETVRVLAGDTVEASSGPWSLWQSFYDDLGTFYQCQDIQDDVQQARRAVWERLSPDLALATT